MSYDSNTKSWSVVSGGSASTPAAQTTEANAAQAATTATTAAATATTAATTTTTAAPPTAAEKKLEKVNLAKKIQKVRLELHECNFLRIPELLVCSTYAGYVLVYSYSTLHINGTGIGHGALGEAAE